MAALTIAYKALLHHIMFSSGYWLLFKGLEDVNVPKHGLLELLIACIFTL